MDKIILGIDPGTATTGFGVVEYKRGKLRLLEYGCIQTSPKELMAQRLMTLHHDLSTIIARVSPHVMAVEQLFFNTNAKTALQIGQARGVILLTAAQAGIDTAEYTPNQIKLAVTGFGHADKKQIQYMVQKLLCIDFIPKPDDAADALAIAICHGHMS